MPIVLATHQSPQARYLKILMTPLSLDLLLQSEYSLFCLQSHYTAGNHKVRSGFPLV